jgi:hypothetical protein
MADRAYAGEAIMIATAAVTAAAASATDSLRLTAGLLSDRLRWFCWH